MLQYRAATCNGFEYLCKHYRKTEPTSTVSVTRCNFLQLVLQWSCPSLSLKTILREKCTAFTEFYHVFVVTKVSLCLVPCSIWDDCRPSLIQLPLFQFANEL